MNELTKRVVIILLAVLACIAAYMVTKTGSPDKPKNDQPIILGTPDIQKEDTVEEHIVGEWGEVVIKKVNIDSTD